jgi:hypothetical protein
MFCILVIILKSIPLEISFNIRYLRAVIFSYSTNRYEHMHNLEFLCITQISIDFLFFKFIQLVDNIEGWGGH